MRDNQSGGLITPEAKREALSRILASRDFQGVERLREFLSYVVGEEIAGRGDAIRAKTIAQDVFHRSGQEGGDPENIVRVEVRRLRQLIEQYYAATGAKDPVRLHLDPGGYRPRFASGVELSALSRNGTVSRSLGYAGLVLLGVILGAGLTSILGPRPTNENVRPDGSGISTPMQDTAEPTMARRKAILTKSPNSLEAINLAEQAQRMIFPIFDLPRQEVLTTVFERVVELDPDYFGGYAGLSNVLSTRAILSSDSESRAALLARSRKMADEALRLAPAEALTQSAAAWAAFAQRDYGEAMRLAELARQIEPSDGQILDTLGTIALFSGNFERALEAANGGEARAGGLQRFANRNIFAAASFHLGNFRDCIEALDNAVLYGDPLSAPSLAYQTAALAAVGRDSDARHKLDELRRAWPKAQLEAMLYGIHSQKENADAVLDRLHALGWSEM